MANRLRESFPRLDVKVRDCVRKCGPCRKNPFAVVDGRTVCGADGEDLYRKILETLSEPS